MAKVSFCRLPLVGLIAPLPPAIGGKPNQLIPLAFLALALSSWAKLSVWPTLMAAHEG